MKIVRASERQLATWDDGIANSFNGTIFHRRRFLAYHGDRFAGTEHFLVALNGQAPFAQIVMAIEETTCGRVARSPYGGSYGGVVFRAQPSFDECREVVLSINEYLRAAGVRRFRMTTPIACCAPTPLDTFHFALLNNGYRSVNRDLSSVVNLQSFTSAAASVSSRARNMLRKAQAHGFSIRRGNLADFWHVMDLTFSKLAARPTHTRAEFATLIEAFPGQVYVDVAYDGADVPVAGIGYMVINRLLNSSFYLCQDPERRAEQALTLLVMHALEESRSANFSAFDFGTSTVNMVARENVIRFKESFTKTAMFRETFEWHDMLT